MIQMAIVNRQQVKNVPKCSRVEMRELSPNGSCCNLPAKNLHSASGIGLIRKKKKEKSGNQF